MIDEKHIKLSSEEKKYNLGINEASRYISGINSIIRTLDDVKLSTKLILLFAFLAGIWIWRDLPLPL